MSPVAFPLARKLRAPGDMPEQPPDKPARMMGPGAAPAVGHQAPSSVWGCGGTWAPPFRVPQGQGTWERAQAGNSTVTGPHSRPT